ncbi:MAG: dihydroneopterin aldolase [Bacteroidales bacterium]
MDIIEIENMEFFSFHGCFKEEQITGNKFLVSMMLYTNLTNASITDNLKDTVNYQTIYYIIKQEMEIPSKLLEHVARRILEKIKSEFGDLIFKQRIKISKVNPALGGKTEKVSVILEI